MPGQPGAWAVWPTWKPALLSTFQVFNITSSSNGFEYSMNQEKTLNIHPLNIWNKTWCGTPFAFWMEDHLSFGIAQFFVSWWPHWRKLSRYLPWQVAKIGKMIAAMKSPDTENPTSGITHIDWSGMSPGHHLNESELHFSKNTKMKTPVPHFLRLH